MQTRLLVVQTAFLGDLVLTQPLVEELARHFAPSPVDLMVRGPFEELARTFRGVADVIPFHKRGADRGVVGFLRQRRAIVQRKYALAVSPHSSFRTGLLLKLAGVRSIGFAKSAAAPLFSTRVPNPGGPYPERLRALLLAVGAGRGNDDPRLDVSAELSRAVDEKLGTKRVHSADAIVGMSPGSVWGTKRWIPEGWGAVAREIAARGFIPVLLGGKEDKGVTHEVVRSSGGVAVDLAGETSLLELAAIAKRARVFVSGDSGPMHVAAAVGTPVVAIFGPTTPELGFAPRIKASEIVQRALECRPCHRHGPQVCPLGHFRCMKEIGAADVLVAIGRLRPEIAA